MGRGLLGRLNRRESGIRNTRKTSPPPPPEEGEGVDAEWKSVKGTSRRMGVERRARERKREGQRERTAGEGEEGGGGGKVSRGGGVMSRAGPRGVGNEPRQLISLGFHNALANERPL